jgi:pyruvate dehydrogenase E1 component alpha subunit
MKYVYLQQFDPLKDETVKVLDATGKVINPHLVPKISNADLITAYKLMNLSRRQDDFQNKQQRLGRLLSFLSSTGQEASEVGYAMHLKKGVDYFCSGYRNNAAWLTTGIPVRNIMLYWVGNEYGARSPEGANVLPPNIVIGSQYSLATGLAFAEKYRKKPGVVLTTTGDGGTSEGETYEAMNFAKLHEVPVIFVVENNQWAISTPRVQATKALNFASKGIGVGMPGIKVDGNDFLAVYGVFAEAFDWVRSGKGPILVECDTYRLGAHSSSDNPDIYRPKDEYTEALKKDPLIRMKAYLESLKIWDEKAQQALDKEQDAHLNAEFKWMLENKDYDLKDIFQFMYAEMTPDLTQQYAEAQAFFAKHPESKEGGH